MAAAKVETTAPEVKFDGTALSARELEQLVSLRVERSVGLAGRATLRFLDPGYVAATTGNFGLGKEVIIGVVGGKQLFRGTVTGVDLDQSEDEVPMLTVIVDDPAYKLTHGTQVRTFQNMKYGDVMKKIAGEAGLKADVGNLGKVTNEYLLQTGTNLDYLDQLVRRSGAVWWVDDASLVARPADATVGSVELTVSDLDPAKQLTRFAVRATGLRSKETTVTGWDTQRETKLVGKSAPASTGASSDFVAPFNGSKPTSALRTEASALVADPPPNSVQEAQELASAMQLDAEADAVVARGTCGINAAITPMAEVRVTNMGPSSGKYVVTEVRHDYSRRGFTTSFVAGPRRPRGLVDALGSAQPDPGFSTTRLVSGVVTNINDPKKLGRVKVKYAGPTQDIESDWGRLVTLGAGAERGITFQPEVNDEVLVGFERGDTRHPVIFGGLFGDTNKLGVNGVNPAGNKVVSRRLTSRLGHFIEFGDDDKPTGQHVLVQLSNGHKFLLGAEQCDLDLQAGKPFTLKAGNSSLAIDKQGNITIEGVNITLKAKSALKLEGLSVETKAQTTMKVEAGASLQVKGSMVQLQSSGPMAVKGMPVAIN
ncbi:MAG TPA: phage baseplate assembly protein V [Nocardioidaceae bacterium]|nr:phage baseplate assembly protein V [Nocardioidaceae bacterium]